ncbi:hypothetical protein GCM10010472_45690 [Pseudonocardia halophobica]|uniref:Uncharacterized protein n=1 Tax=Pseudonocardia halophobica TaxID=29401 RepID=A0A9W6NYH6_9PSEU|nr:hypothetical protein [Pseudonocardia halophobica]GLL13904.1 hypothetical protein GCM10017577_50490 [Pseudonocardia halophobica]
MSAQGEFLHHSHGSRTGRSRAVATRRVLGPLTVALIGASAWATAGLVASPLAQQDVKLAAAVTPAAMQGSCSAGWKMMSIPEMLRMIEPPATPDNVRATDANRDNYLCASLSANGFHVTRFVDNVRTTSSGSGCSGGMDNNGMPTGCNGDGMKTKDKTGDGDDPTHPSGGGDTGQSGKPDHGNTGSTHRSKSS